VSVITAIHNGLGAVGQSIGGVVVAIFAIFFVGSPWLAFFGAIYVASGILDAMNAGLTIGIPALILFAIFVFVYVGPTVLHRLAPALRELTKPN
jgi:hypothetical protein